MVTTAVDAAAGLETPYLLQIQVEQGVISANAGHKSYRFRVYLTADEVDDLKVVLRYAPSWLPAE